MEDNLDFPDFLKRRKGERRPKGPAKVLAMPVTPSSWARIQEQRKAKSRGRVAKMLAIKADREAAAAGKTWDAVRGGWR